MGKTALATNIAFHVATAALKDPDLGRQVVAVFSLEMSAEQLATRILAEQTEISSEHIRRGELTTDDFQKLVAASQILSVRLYMSMIHRRSPSPRCAPGRDA